MNENLLIKADTLGLGVGKVANMELGAQLGAGINVRTLDAATPLTLPPVVLVVMQTPGMYDKEPAIARMIKTLIERHAKTVSGIDFGYTLETQAHAVGFDGQEMEVPTKTKRSAISPSFTFQEVSGNLIWNLFSLWQRDIQDPDTHSAFARFEEAIAYVMSNYCMSMCVIQFDQTHRPENFIDAAFITNMFPKDIGQLGLERQIGTTKIIERSVQMSGYIQHNSKTKALGIAIAEQLQLARVNFAKAAAGMESVESLLADSGLQDEVAKVLAAQA